MRHTKTHTHMNTQIPNILAIPYRNQLNPIVHPTDCAWYAGIQTIWLGYSRLYLRLCMLATPCTRSHSNPKIHYCQCLQRVINKCEIIITYRHTYTHTQYTYRERERACTNCANQSLNLLCKCTRKCMQYQIF